MRSIINSHNRKIISKQSRGENQKCNCLRNSICPLNGKCLSTNTLYAGTITSDLTNYGAKEYAGISEPPWKTRLGNHKLSFNKRIYAKTKIAKEVWSIKDQGGRFYISWRVIRHATGYHPVAGNCKLCLNEKLYIAENHENLINQRDELVTKCRHQNKFALMRNDTRD